ncbi:LysR family transcriptional regulator [Chelativorans salis]|uniref:LysR family transcriptional regulator n=1 Tax=Chelativorans salis TaxID=2978478 RepID=A0ABT2LXP6_9HYPH|nr:LysR family transcriptional regulator [Chelativorans sp. EGI FJ00035]MCT7378153.1 LysR family transcriptional regulator [Chelativorans sp. EGI FJ00035]
MRLLISRHLENFLALYDARNMHAAADKKGISQPALTKSLRLLEKDFGAELFVRTPKGLEPTDAGDALYRHARTIDQEARFASMDIQDIHHNLGGRIRIGVGPILTLSIFPAVLVDFHQQFPFVEVTVETGVSSQLVQSLARGNLDVVVTALPEQPLPEGYVGLPLIKNDMTVICREDHPLRSRGEASLDELSCFGLVGFTDDREFAKHSRRVFGSRAEKLQPVLQTTSLSVMFGILAATDYFAILSTMILLRARREGLDRLPVQHDLWQIEIALMCKESLIGSRPISAIKEALLARV